MAAVDIFILRGHRGRVRKRPRGDFIPQCACGYQGPSYGVEEEAIFGLDVHMGMAVPMRAVYLAIMFKGPGRADPEDRLTQDGLMEALLAEVPLSESEVWM